MSVHHIDSDVVFTPLDGKALVDGNGSFRSCSTQTRSAALRILLGTQIDDATALLPDHDAPGSLTSEKCSFQMDG